MSYPVLGNQAIALVTTPLIGKASLIWALVLLHMALMGKIGTGM
jgi:hypothetical protein